MPVIIISFGVDFDQSGARASWLELSTGKFVLAQSDSLRIFFLYLVLCPQSFATRGNVPKNIEIMTVHFEELDRLATGVKEPRD